MEVYITVEMAHHAFAGAFGASGLVLMASRLWKSWSLIVGSWLIGMGLAIFGTIPFHNLLEYYIFPEHHLGEGSRTITAFFLALLGPVFVRLAIKLGDYLEENPSELWVLFKDMLGRIINTKKDSYVTGFYSQAV